MLHDGDMVLDHDENLVGIVIGSPNDPTDPLSWWRIHWFNLGMFSTPVHMVNEAMQTGEWTIQPDLKDIWGWEFPRDEKVATPDQS